MFNYELQRRLSGSGAATIAVAAHPGVSSSELVRNSPLVLRALNAVFSPLSLHCAVTLRPVDLAVSDIGEPRHGFPLRHLTDPRIRPAARCAPPQEQDACKVSATADRRRTPLARHWRARLAGLRRQDGAVDRDLGATGVEGQVAGNVGSSRDRRLVGPDNAVVALTVQFS